MNFDWYDAWPALALGALLYGACLASGAREWWHRRKARRRARVLCAPAPDLTGCIQRAGEKTESEKVRKWAGGAEVRQPPTFPPSSLSHLPPK